MTDHQLTITDSEPYVLAREFTIAFAAATGALGARRCFVPGAPAPQGSKRHVGAGRMIESSKAVGPWRERVALAVHAERWPMISGPVWVRLQFVLPRPKSTPKRSTPPAVKKPDLDKLQRAILDALTGIAFTDDSQVICIFARKRIAEIDEPPGVLIEVADYTEEI